ncbi:MAG: metallophosphoesterase [Deltaproteobacteria bacterium]|jgi:uncharacterized protein|nr:metallophosphoesterase [Deltaproteobacteria bacterium]
MGNQWFFILFIIIVITVYSFLNYYFIRKKRKSITLEALPKILLRLLLFTLFLAPIATFALSRYGSSFFSVITTFIGFSWLAFLFLFLMIHGAIDILFFIIEKFGVTLSRNIAKLIFITTMVISISILIYGRFEAQQLKLERIEIKTDKLPSNIDQLKIVQLSDVHFSSLLGVADADKLLQIINKEAPDLILSTGDLLDAGIKEPKAVIEVLKKMQAPLGKYAITGNHEYITGIETSVQFIENAGFTLLRDEVIPLKNILNLIGVEDSSANQFANVKIIPESKLFSLINPNKFTILMKHQPRVDPESIPYFDLQLSGHTHAGQIFPFTLLVKLVFPYICGLYDLTSGKKLYVSRGTGTWGPPFRFLAPPELTFITIKK